MYFVNLGIDRFTLLVYNIVKLRETIKEMLMKNATFTTNEFNKEIFTKDFIDCNGIDLVLRLLAASLTYGIEKVEIAIDNTFAKQESNKIKLMMNTAMKFSV